VRQRDLHGDLRQPADKNSSTEKNSNRATTTTKRPGAFAPGHFKFNGEEN
jgi:hypothetical protein